jgi:hypothetical protein
MKKLLLLVTIIPISILAAEQATKLTTPLAKGFKGYVPIETLLPGQLRFTQANVDTKAKKLSARKQAFDNGKSSIPDTEPIPVIIGPGGLRILKDSHHELLVAKKVGDTTAPITVVDDLSNLSREDFFNTAQEANHIYPVDLQGNSVAMPKEGWFSWNMMVDDPNRYFAAISAVKCPDEKHEGFSEGKNNNYPLWVKRLWEKVKLAFIEFKISTALNKAGIKYTYNMGDDLSKEPLASLVEQARLALAKKEYAVAGLDLIPTKMQIKEINQDKGGICTYTYAMVQESPESLKEMQSKAQKIISLGTMTSTLSSLLAILKERILANPYFVVRLKKRSADMTIIIQKLYKAAQDLISCTNDQQCKNAVNNFKNIKETAQNFFKSIVNDYPSLQKTPFYKILLD